MQDLFKHLWDVVVADILKSGDSWPHMTEACPYHSPPQAFDMKVSWYLNEPHCVKCVTLSLHQTLVLFPLLHRPLLLQKKTTLRKASKQPLETFFSK